MIDGMVTKSQIKELWGRRVCGQIMQHKVGSPMLATSAQCPGPEKPLVVPMGETPSTQDVVCSLSLLAVMQ